MANSIYSQSFNSIYSRIIKYGNDFNKIYRTLPKTITKLTTQPMNLYYNQFILPHQYKESYLEFDVDFNSTNGNTIQSLLNYAVLLRYVHGDLANPESVLLKLWSVAKNIKDKHPNIIFEFSAESLTQLCVIPAFSDTPDNLISKYNIDVEQLHYNFVTNHPRYFINPKIKKYSDAKNKTISDEYRDIVSHAQTSWLLYSAKNNPSKLDEVWANQSEYTQAVNYISLLKESKISVTNFINILEIYDENLPNTFIMNNLNVTKVQINNFKTAYNKIFCKNIKRSYTKKSDKDIVSEKSVSIINDDDLLNTLSGNKQNTENIKSQRKMSPNNVHIFGNTPEFETDNFPSFSIDMSECIDSDNKQLDNLTI